MLSPLAFTIRVRRGDGDTQQGRPGEAITVEERVEYVLRFAEAVSPAIHRRLTDLGGEFLAPHLAVLTFGNFVGRAELAGVAINVVSTKVGPDGVSRVLQEVSDLASSLIFGWQAPTSFEGLGDQSHHMPVPYHQLQYLRHITINERVGRRLQDWLGTIERSPTRRFEPERPVVSLDRVRRLDRRAVQSIFSRLERLVPVPAEVAIVSNPLAHKLTFGNPARTHLPAKVAAPRGRLSFDTPENRFVKHVVGDCLALVHRFVDHPRLHPGLKADSRTILSILEQCAAAPYLAEAGRLAGLQAPSQALAKADGYREVFAFWGQLTRHVSLPRTTAETTRLLEGRDMATLYEYWVFVKILEATVALTGLAPSGPPVIRRDELGESLSLGLTTSFGPNIAIHFNPTFRRTVGTAYSTPLRPDVVVEVGQTRHAFDAKYRLDRFDAGEADSDDDPATYKRADLYKMHTYRDAIARLRTAFVVYPGTEFVFFERTGSKSTEPAAITLVDGVGAVPLRPADADPATRLREVLRALLIPQGLAP